MFWVGYLTQTTSLLQSMQYFLQRNYTVKSEASAQEKGKKKKLLKA